MYIYNYRGEKIIRQRRMYVYIYNYRGEKIIRPRYIEKKHP